MRRLLLVAATLALITSACGDSDSGTTTDTGLPEDPDRCEVVDQQVLDYLSTGLVTDDVSLPWGFSVKSTDYPDVWIIAAGVEDQDQSDYATWAIRAGNWPTEYVGTVAVDELAKLITNWGEGVDVIVTDATNGIKSARACAIARLDAEGQ
jgi:hypothetical protein